jgi:hypothetical protein
MSDLDRSEYAEGSDYDPTPYSGDDQTSYASPDDSTLYAAPGDPGDVQANNDALKAALDSLAEATGALRVSTNPEDIKVWTQTALWRANVAAKSPNEFDNDLEAVYVEWRDLPVTAGTSDEWIKARDMLVDALDTFERAARNSTVNDSKDLVMRNVMLDQELQKLTTAAGEARRAISD